MEKNIAKETIINYKKTEQVVRQAGAISALIILSSFLLLFLTARKANEIKSAHNIIEQSRLFEKNRQKAENLLERYKGKDSKISQLYPNNKTIIEFVKAIEYIGSESTSEANFSFDFDNPRKDKEQYSYLSYTIRLNTNLNGLLVFLEKFENLPYLTLINQIYSTDLESIMTNGVYVIKADVYTQEPFSI